MHNSFPDEEKDSALFAEWVDSIKKWSPLTVLTKWSRVCSDNIKRMSGHKMYLEDGAVPTLFQQVQGDECTASTEKEVSGHFSLHHHSYCLKSPMRLKRQLEDVIDRAEFYRKRFKFYKTVKSRCSLSPRIASFSTYFEILLA